MSHWLRSARSALPAALFATVAAGAGCVSPSTHMVIALDSDIPASRITQIRVKLLDPTTRATVREQVLFPREGVPSVLPLPASFTVVPGRGARDSAGEVRIEMTAIGLDSRLVTLSRSARFLFIPARRGIARVFINASCDLPTTGCAAGVSRCTVAELCEARGLTCGDLATCVVPDVPVEPYDADVELLPDVRRLPPDASPGPSMDASADASADGGSCDPARCPPRTNSVARCDAAGQCAYACVDGFADCDMGAGNGCESSLSSNSNCGRCGNACAGATPLCNGATGMCSSSCASGQMLCGMSCVDVQTDEGNCGACGRMCRADQRCAAGSCACASGAECGGRCVDTQTDSGNCGACGRSCRADQRCVAGACACTSGTECGGRCVDTQSDNGNCGMCGRVCAFSRAAGSCAAGACQLGACDSGWGNCDGNSANGCEQDLSASTHCGRCGNACSGASPVCSAGACSSGCVAGQTRCGMTCANLMSDRNHCGACGRACRADQTCSGGTCQCTSGTDCSGACVDLNSSLANCGACGRSCAPPNATPSCSSGTCRITACSAGFADCNGSVSDGCEARLDTTTSCGACGVVCAAGPNQSAACVANACRYTCTLSGRGDCNGSTVDGCEADLNSNLTHCGACGNACPARANATTTCTAGSCGFTCNAGFGDCDGNAANGCEQSLTSPSHCGMCGRACSGGTPMCSGGTCVSGCTGGQVLCSGTCVTLASDVNNCSACGNACPARANATTTCSSSTCGFTCNMGWGNCDGNAANGCETNLNTTVGHCGMCGNICASVFNASATCTSGLCGFACNMGFDNCDGMPGNGCETTVSSNVNNCGGCGVSCPARSNASRTCTGSTCGFSCNSGFANCNSAAMDGCEADLNNDTSNCGMCGRTCAAGATCSGGSCSCPAGEVLCGGACVDTNTSNAHCGACFNSCPATSGCCGGMCVPGIGQECAFNCQRQSVRICGPSGMGEGICPNSGPMYSPLSASNGIQCDTGGGFWGFCGSGMCNLL
jgi:Stigma-specific protein, Stig1